MSIAPGAGPGQAVAAVPALPLAMLVALALALLGGSAAMLTRRWTPGTPAAGA